MRYSLIHTCICLFIITGPYLRLHAQSVDTTKVYDFHVSNRVNGAVELIRKDSVLYTNYDNYIEIKADKGVKLGLISVNGAQLKRFKNSLVIRVESRESVLLTVFQIKPDGSQSIVYAENIKVVELEAPYITVSGVKNDSIVNRRDLLADGRLIAHQTLFGQYQRFYVSGFNLGVYQNGKLILMSSKNNKLTPVMRETIKGLKPGIPLQFSRIRCVMKDGKIQELDPIRIFLDQRSKLVSVNSE